VIATRTSPAAFSAGFVGTHCDKQTILSGVLATPAGIEPAANSLEVVRKPNNFNGYSDKTAVPAALLDKTKFQFVGITLHAVKLGSCAPPATGTVRPAN
jgi:hypothetical protein